MKIATFNINSINKRQELVQTWANSNNIDIICMQELKTLNPFSIQNYECKKNAQKRFNGVSTCSIYPILEYKSDLVDEARFLYTKINDLHIINIYAPLGDLYGERFEYKLKFYSKLISFLKNFNLQKEKLILLGDFNIIHKNIDVFDANKWEGHITFLPEEREIFNQLLNLGLYDTFRELYPNKKEFSFFDYRDKGFKRGLRLDYILTTKPILNNVNDIYIDINPRLAPTPSDHTPVVMDFDDR